jgi:hypothetical protein
MLGVLAAATLFGTSATSQALLTPDAPGPSVAAMRRAASGEMVAISTTTAPRLAPSMRPIFPSVTSSQSAAVVTMVTMISDARATAAGDSASAAPAFTRAAAAVARRA